MLRRVMLAASRSERLREATTTFPLTRPVVSRFVAGAAVDDALRVAGELVSAGLFVSLDRLGEHTLDEGAAEITTAAYIDLVERITAAGLAGSVEVSLKPTSLGLSLEPDGEKLATRGAQAVCQAAAAAGVLVTLDMEDHATTDATLRILAAVRADVPSTGAVVQAYLRRTEADCRALATAGSRVRLVKGAYQERAAVAFTARRDVDRSFVRCLRVLMAGDGYPMVATHDPRLIEIAGTLAHRHGRMPGGFEYQMLYGVRPAEQRRLAELGQRVRVYVPYGQEWYPYLMRRLAERPANLTFFLRALTRNT